MMQELQVVWLKRDLRLRDHRPMCEAAQAGPVLVIYVAEPSIWTAGDLSARHLKFVEQSLHDMQQQLLERGCCLYTAVAEMEDVLQAIQQTYGRFRLLAHEENGAPNTYARDVRVHRWMRARGLPFVEYQQFGVTRRLPNRDEFSARWERFMTEPAWPALSAFSMELPVAPPLPLQPGIHLTGLFDIVPGTLIQEGQPGGERWALATLADFLGNRFAKYQSHISRPYESMHSCARISTYLAWGNLSLRETVKQTRERLANCEPHQRRHLEGFYSRLHWHCHFIQRLEDDPRIAEQTMNPVFEGLRSWDETLFERWLTGHTGFPAVDAAMRALWQTGWLHFRGRAMVVSFICNTLLLDWRKPAQALAQLFLDYEPGIHFSQIQMQAGTTGFNTIRIYNPVKQSQEYDQHGRFIKRFVPELRTLTTDALHEPWQHIDPVTLGYVRPVVDLAEANRHARDVLWGARAGAKRSPDTARLLNQHGSRGGRASQRSANRQKSQKTNKKSDLAVAPEQLSFDFGDLL